MKPVNWVSDSREAVKDFPVEARQLTGYQLDRLQRGAAPHDWKPMPSIGAGVNEIRIHAGSEYRVIYVAKFAEAVYVLHAFAKKTRKTSTRDLELAANRYRALLNSRREP
ncbi:MAG: type II toxin-antitoxin system RelE/ParE family toxin [Gammaproteobacteria bacterium]